MKLKVYSLSILLVIALLFLFSWNRQGYSDSATRWEYKVLPNIGELTLNDLGAQGWELVAVSQNIQNGNSHTQYYYLKRAK